MLFYDSTAWRLPLSQPCCHCSWRPCAARTARDGHGGGGITREHTVHPHALWARHSGRFHNALWCVILPFTVRLREPPAQRETPDSAPGRALQLA